MAGRIRIRRQPHDRRAIPKARIQKRRAVVRVGEIQPRIHPADLDSELIARQRLLEKKLVNLRPGRTILIIEHLRIAGELGRAVVALMIQKIEKEKPAFPIQ